MTLSCSRRVATRLIGSSLLLPAGAFAQSGAYPGTRVGRVIIAFGPGTAGDFIARLVAERLAQQTGGNFIVENRPGAGGATGTKAAATAAPDGYTLLLGSNATLIINPTVGKAPYDAEKDFVPIGTIARTSMVLVTAATPTAPRSVAELVERLRAQPGSYGSTGVGALGNLSAELFLRRTGTTAVHAPYKGSSELLPDVSRGEVLFAFDAATAVLPLVRGGKLRALGITGPSRLDSLEGVATLQEQGVSGMDVTVWYCLMAPAGTPAPILERLDAELTRMHADPEVVKRLRTVELQPFPLPASRFKSFFGEELKFWRQVVAGMQR